MRQFTVLLRNGNRTMINKKEAKQVAGAFLSQWKKADYESMFAGSTLTYRHHHSLALFKLFFSYSIASYKVLAVKPITHCVADIKAEVGHPEGKLKVQFRLMKELAPFFPSADGEWLISPKSFKRIGK